MRPEGFPVLRKLLHHMLEAAVYLSSVKPDLIRVTNQSGVVHSLYTQLSLITYIITFDPHS